MYNRTYGERHHGALGYSVFECRKAVASALQPRGVVLNAPYRQTFQLSHNRMVLPTALGSILPFGME